MLAELSWIWQATREDTRWRVKTRATGRTEYGKVLNLV